jgi:hypothetical protein
MASLLANHSFPNSGCWQEQHDDAVVHALGKTTHTVSDNNFASITVQQLSGWAAYARAHKSQYKVSISKCSVLGPAWRSIGLEMRKFIEHGDTTDLDHGTLDMFIMDVEGKRIRRKGIAVAIPTGPSASLR